MTLLAAITIYFGEFNEPDGVLRSRMREAALTRISAEEMNQNSFLCKETLRSLQMHKLKSNPNYWKHRKIFKKIDGE